MVSSDGDLQGGDLPGWLTELHGGGLIASLADRRGECIHAACPHWRRCFVEHTIRRSRTAELVVANHALVMTQAAWGGLDDNAVPTRYVFDEGHHLFDAADSAFSAAFSGLETAELRRWLRGAEGGRSRARGLRKRLEELVADRPALIAPLDAALQAAGALPPSDWSSRLHEAGPELDGIEPARPNPSEAFLRLVRRQVLARTRGGDAEQPSELARRQIGATTECDVFPVNEDLAQSADRLARALARIAEPLATLRERLLARLDEEAEDMDEATRNRIEAIGRSLMRRALNPLQAWQSMLRTLTEPPAEPGQRPGHVLFLRLDRRDGGRTEAIAQEGGRDTDVGLHRHWLDPTIPFAATLASPAQGLLVTSATLRDTGATVTLKSPGRRQRHGSARRICRRRRSAPPSPHHSITRSRPAPSSSPTWPRAIWTSWPPPIVPCLSHPAVAASGCSRRSAGCAPCTPASRPSWSRPASHFMPSTSTRWAMPRWSTSSAPRRKVACSAPTRCATASTCRARALRLVVFERMPWPRPGHPAPRTANPSLRRDPKGYDDRIVRLRLRQAFGRLIRRASDRGVFVLLDRQAPSWLMSAFPPGVVVASGRLGGGSRANRRIPADASHAGDGIVTRAAPRRSLTKPNQQATASVGCLKQNRVLETRALYRPSAMRC